MEKQTNTDIRLWIDIILVELHCLTTAFKVGQVKAYTKFDGNK